jgi:hypothetical protein
LRRATIFVIVAIIITVSRPAHSFRLRFAGATRAKRFFKQKVSETRSGRHFDASRQSRTKICFGNSLEQNTNFSGLG